MNLSIKVFGKEKHMTQLVSTYLSQGKIYEALLVAQNLAYKNCDKVNVEDYWKLLIHLTKETNDLMMASKYIERAKALLAFFSENVEIDEEMVDFLIDKRSQLDTISNELHQKVLSKEQEIFDNNASENSRCLSLIDRLADDISDTTDEDQYNKRLDQIRAIDSKIKKEFLRDDQKVEYERLTKKCAQIVSNRASFFELKKNIEYNNEAVQAYEKAYNFIKSGKEFDEHLDIIKSMFSFDASRLFSETLIYYNHVYSYIFSKLSDEEKLLFTKVAINLSKKR